ncbi:MAG: hydratase [Rhodospirillaceae bacterium]|jgi:2-oxo-3-hexenedioate decarboxylase/2-keto-4-pentenoate hydratase|nr:hydratase [Rhodospirillaceae bacterium]MBT3491377.1 hydratase [Rhodospirillaceae bacterium]MBT3782900.1 hydratase [Rhodospirillaceae bacterium]MBT3977871.1 hydratase [Rhodospirillaceae bacterium]MBT4166957.1 hydratase [Rhodospirillaceae bacterium]
MASDPITGAARYLFDAAQAKQQGAPLPAGLAPPDVATAYLVQDILQALWVEAGAGKVAGWKVALTSKVMQELVGVGQPCEGAVFASRVHRGAVSLPYDNFVNIGVESEIAVRIAHDLPASGGPYDQDSIREAVASCMAAIEIVDDRAIDYSLIDAPLLIADNSFNAGCILGDEISDWQDLDLAALAGRMLINGEVVGEGVGGDALGHPLVPLSWLANNLNDRGTMLRAGDVVLTGSIVATKWLQPGDHMVTEVDGLGRASLTVT